MSEEERLKLENESLAYVIMNLKKNKKTYKRLAKKQRQKLRIKNQELQRKIDLASGLLEKYIGVLDDVADGYFENVLSILQGKEMNK